MRVDLARPKPTESIRATASAPPATIGAACRGHTSPGKTASLSHGRRGIAWRRIAARGADIRTRLAAGRRTLASLFVPLGSGRTRCYPAPAVGTLIVLYLVALAVRAATGLLFSGPAYLDSFYY